VQQQDVPVAGSRRPSFGRGERTDTAFAELQARIVQASRGPDLTLALNAYPSCIQRWKRALARFMKTRARSAAVIAGRVALPFMVSCGLARGPEPPTFTPIPAESPATPTPRVQATSTPIPSNAPAPFNTDEQGRLVVERIERVRNTQGQVEDVYYYCIYISDSRVRDWACGSDPDAAEREYQRKLRP
jgi:hypothetical protein